MIKKRINGRMYNTATAKMVWGSEHTNPAYELYKKRNKEYFLYRWYSFGTDEHDLDSILPLTEAEAKNIMKHESEAVKYDVASTIASVRLGIINAVDFQCFIEEQFSSPVPEFQGKETFLMAQRDILKLYV